MRRRKDTLKKQIDYSRYRLSIREIIKYFIVICLMAGIFAYVFYKSFIAFIVFMMPLYGYMRLISFYLNKRRRNELKLQFKEFCLSLCTQLITGHSLESSIIEIHKEMENIYGKNSYICSEIMQMDTKLKVNITIEKCFEEFAERSQIEEIELFAEIIKIAKRTGGDIIEIVRSAADSISRNIEVEREIRIIINGKKQEHTVMCFIPIFMILYVSFTSPDMMGVLYEGIFGRFFMSVCLILYIIAVFLGMRFTEIEI